MDIQTTKERKDAAERKALILIAMVVAGYAVIFGGMVLSLFLKDLGAGLGLASLIILIGGAFAIRAQR